MATTVFSNILSYSRLSNYNFQFTIKKKSVSHQQILSFKTELNLLKIHVIEAPEIPEFWTGLTARTKYQREEEQVQPWKGLSDCPGVCLALSLLAVTVVGDR